jgi:hypothetical protein
MTELGMEAYARLLAHLACRRGTRMDEILADLGLDAGALAEGEAALREELTSAWTRRSGILAMKFATALGKELSLLGPAGSAGTDPARPDPEPLPEPASGLPRETDLPSFLQPVAPAPSPLIPLAPLAPLAPPTPSAPCAPSAPAPEIAKLAATGDLDLQAVLAALRRGPLPFAQSPSPGPAGLAEKAPSQGAAAPRPRPTGTVQADYQAVEASVQQGPLPFAPAVPAAPAAPPEEGDFALLPLETYASVSGALARGEAREEALAKHHISAEEFDRLAKVWSQRFQREPHLFARFKELATGSAAAAGRRGE